MPKQFAPLQSVTKIDISLRKEMRELAEATNEADRRNTIIQIDQLKKQRHEMTKTRGFNRMIRSLG